MLSNISQEMVVECIINSIDKKWTLAYVNTEFDVLDGQPVSNTVVFTYTLTGNKWTGESILVDRRIINSMKILRESMSSLPGGPWSVCTVEVADTGHYKFIFSYDKPVRIYDMLAGNKQFEAYNASERYTELTN